MPNNSTAPPLGARPRKLAGVFALLIGLPVYAGAAAWIAITLVPDSRILEIFYYLVAGLAWILPVMPLIKWMNRDHTADARKRP